MISKKILWGLLILFISFDNIFSYIAIVYHGMREWNPTTAFFVSITPLFYFISIPLTLLVLHLVIKVNGWLAGSKSDLKEFAERLALTCLVIAWGVGVTSFNATTLLSGFSSPKIDYRIVLITGALLAAIYAFYMSYRMKRKK